MGDSVEKISQLSVAELLEESQKTRQSFFAGIKNMGKVKAPEIVVDDSFVNDAQEEMERIVLENPEAEVAGEASVEGEVSAKEVAAGSELSMEEQLMGKGKAKEEEPELSMEEQLMGKAKKEEPELSMEEQLMGKGKAKEEEPELSMEEQLMGKGKAKKEEPELSMEEQLMGKSKAENTDEPERMTLDLSESEDEGISDDEIAKLSNSIEEEVSEEISAETAADAQEGDLGARAGDKEHVVVDHPNDVDQETVDRLMAEAKAKASEIAVEVKRYDIELEGPKDFCDVHLDIEAAEQLKVESKFKAIFEQKKAELEAGMKAHGSTDEGALDQGELDALFDKPAEAVVEESSDDAGSEVLNQADLDALFDKPAETESDDDKVLDQSELDALFDKPAEAVVEESSDDAGSEVLNQADLDALFDNPAEAESDDDKVLDQSELDALFDNPAEVAVEEDGVLDQSELDALFDKSAEREDVSEAVESSIEPVSEVELDGAALGTPTVELSERVALTDDEKVVFEHPNEITQDLVNRLMDKVREQVESLDKEVKMPEEELKSPETTDLQLSLEECRKAEEALAAQRRHIELDKDYDFYLNISREISEGDQEIVEDIEVDKAMKFVENDNGDFQQVVPLPEEELMAPEKAAESLHLDFVEALELSVGKGGRIADKIQDKLQLIEDVIDNASTFVSEDALQQAKQVEEENLEDFSQEIKADEQELIKPENIADLHLNLDEAQSLALGSLPKVEKASAVEETVSVEAQELPETLSMDDIDSLFANSSEDETETEEAQEQPETLSMDDIDSLFANNSEDETETEEAQELPETLSMDDIDSLFANSSEDETETEEAEENMTLSMDDIDDLFASSEGPEEDKISETVSNDELDALFEKSAEVDVAEEHPNDVAQETVDALMEEVKEQVNDFEQVIVRYEQELIVPETTDLHLELSDVELLNSLNSKPAVDSASEPVEESAVVTEPVEEESETLNNDELDALFANGPEEPAEEELPEMLSNDDLDALFADTAENSVEVVEDKLSETVSNDELDALFEKASDIDVAEEHPNDVAQETVDTLMEEVKEQVNDFEQEIVRPEQELTVPATTDLHLEASDVELLNSFSPKIAVDSAEVAEPVEEEVSEILSNDDLDALFANASEDSAEEESIEEPETLNNDDLDALFASASEDSAEEESIEEPETLNNEDLDTLFANASEDSAEEESIEEPETLNNEDLDALFASAPEDSAEVVDEKSSETVSNDELDALFEKDTEVDVAEEHPNDVAQETIDALMEEAKGQVGGFEQEIVRPEQELNLPDLAELHLTESDVEALHNYYDKSVKAVAASEDVVSLEEDLEAPVSMEEDDSAGEILSRDDLDALFKESPSVVSEERQDGLNSLEPSVKDEASSNSSESQQEVLSVSDCAVEAKDDPVMSALERLKALRSK